MKKLSKQFKKTLSMVIAIAIIMSVCAVSFGTFGNAYTVGNAQTYHFDFLDAEGNPCDTDNWDAELGKLKFVYNDSNSKGDGGVTHVVSSSRYFNTAFYGLPNTKTPNCLELIDTSVNMGSNDGRAVIEAGKTYDIEVCISRIENVNNPILVSLGLMDSEGKVFPLIPKNVNGPSVENKDTWRMFYKSTASSNPADKFYLKTVIDGSAINQYNNAAYANCSLVLLFGSTAWNPNAIIAVNYMNVSTSTKPQDTKCGKYELDFTDTTGYNAENGRVELNAYGSAPTYTALNAQNVRWFNFDFYGASNANFRCVELNDKTPYIGSSTGEIIIEEDTIYDISINIGFETAKYVRAALALKDESDKYFFLEPTGVVEGAQSASDTWAWSNTNANKVLKATIDGSGSRTISGTEHKFAGCQLVILVFSQPNQVGSFYVYDGEFFIQDKSVEKSTLNYVKDSDGTTVYRTSGGSSTKPEDSDNPLIFTEIDSNWMSSYINSDGYFRFWYTQPTAIYSTTNAEGKYVPNTELVQYYGKTTSGRYEYFKVADPDLITDDNTLGIVTIESGKNYVFDAEAFLINNGNASDIERWLSFGLYNPIDNAIYPLPGDKAFIHSDGNDLGSTFKQSMTVEIDSATIGANGLPYVGCQLIIIGGNEARKTTAWGVGNIDMFTYDSDKYVTVDAKTYDYRYDDLSHKYTSATKDILYHNTNPTIHVGTQGVEPHGRLTGSAKFLTTSMSKLDGTTYVPNEAFFATGNESYTVISDPDLATANNEYGILTVEYGKNYKISLSVALTSYPNKTANRWVSIGLRDKITTKVFWLEGADVHLFTGGSYSDYVITAEIDSTKVDPESNTLYAGCDVVVLFGGEAGDNSNVRVFPTQVYSYDNADAVNQGGGVAIRPEIDSDGYNSEHYIDYTEGAAEGTYGYQSAAIRFDYLVADVVIANATSGGFKVVPVASKDLIGKTDWANVTGAVDSGDLIGENKKYADGDDYDIYAVTITGLTREGVDKDLCQIYFDVCFYYTVNGKTFYVPVEYVANSYKDTYLKYAELDAAGQFDADVYGQLAWFNRGY